MNLRGKAATVCAGACLVAVLVVTPSAQAAVTASSITTPTSPTFLLWDYDAASNTFAISGTTTGGTTGDHVDIRCYYGDVYRTVASGVAVNQDGSISLPTADGTSIGSRPCRLRVVPAGTTPADLSPFAGPLIGGDYRKSYKVSGGPNDGTVYDYYIYAQQFPAAFDYDSLASCGIDDGYLYDPTTLAETTVTYWCNGGLFFNPGIGRSELQVDGANAYPPDDARYVNANGSGFPALTYSFSIDQKSGDLVIHETDPIVKCTDATYPPNPQSCATFVSAGVSDTRTIVQDHDGKLSWLTDVFKSTDGKSHKIDMLWDNNQRFHWQSGDSTQVEYQFPGESGYTVRAEGDGVSLPATAPGTILVRVHGSADGDPLTGRGAIVYDRPAGRAFFRRVSASSASTFTLSQKATVPAHGSQRFRFAYAQDLTQASVDSLAALAVKTFKGCTVPKVTGKSLAAAKKAITKAGCTVGKVKKAYSAKVKKGRVISSKPKAGTHADYHAKIALTLSRGKKK